MWELTPKFEVVSVWYGRTVIHSRYKLFYEVSAQSWTLHWVSCQQRNVLDKKKSDHFQKLQRGERKKKSQREVSPSKSCRALVHLCQTSMNQFFFFDQFPPFSQSKKSKKFRQHFFKEIWSVSDNWLKFLVSDQKNCNLDRFLMFIWLKTLVSDEKLNCSLEGFLALIN